MMNVLTQVTEFLDGVPGHKNLIWLASTFPLALSRRKEDPREYEDQIINEINVLTECRIVSLSHQRRRRARQSARAAYRRPPARR